MAMKIKRRTVESEIPTSSMADIAFLLIIFFMLTAAFATTKGIGFGLPSDDPNDLRVQQQQAVYIKVLGESNYTVNDQPAALLQIRDLVGGRLQANPKTPVIIDTDPNAPFNAMLEVMDEVRLTGAQNISIPTDQDRKRWQLLRQLGR